MKNSSALKSAIIVVSGGLVATPAIALELGELKVHSAIGQPLRASIAYALAPSDALSDTCVSIQRVVDSAGLPVLENASMIVADGVIAITGSSIVREPMMIMRLNVRCPYTAQLTREYMIFVDPIGTAAAPIAAPVASQPQISTPQAAAAPVAVRRPSVSREPIAGATRYQVRLNDTLGKIAQRVKNRPVGVWNTVNLIFDMNPDAFVDNDPNKLMAGSWLSIPSFSSDGSPAVTTVDTAKASPVEANAVASSYEPATVYSPAATDGSEAGLTEQLEQPKATKAANPLADVQPGDVILDSNNPFVSPIDSDGGESVVIPNTLLDGPVATSSSPNVPVAMIQPAAPAETSSTNWLLWLAGGGVAIIIGMLLFGRRFRDRIGSAPVAPSVPQPRQTDDDVQKVEPISDINSDIEADSAPAEDLALDAELVVGTDLQDGAEVDVAQDFAFSAMANLESELAEDMSSNCDSSETDIIPPLRFSETTILESEVLPSEEDDYDMSVVVDATKMPNPGDVAEHDLEAIAVDTDDEMLITSDYTLSQDVDYNVLEQDYEDEMTASRSCNAELQKAAEELAARMDDQAGDATAGMPLATVHELDVITPMPANNEQAVSDDEETGDNPTVDMGATGNTVEMGEEKTVEVRKGGKKAG